MGQQQSNTEAKEGSLLSTLIAEHLNPEKESLPAPYGSQDCRTDEGIVETALGFLEANTRTGEKYGVEYQYCRPSLIKYAGHQWLWDDCAHAIVLSHVDTARAARHLRTMLAMQTADGRIPEIIYWGEQSLVEEMSSRSVFTENHCPDLTQMPLPPFVLQALYRRTGDKAIVNEFLPKIVRYYQWWKNVRAPDDDGLVVIVHPWESGLDASPAYDRAWGITDPRPAFMELYPNFWKVLLKYKLQYSWQQERIAKDISGSCFVFKDVGVNSVYAAGWGILSILASEVGDSQCSDMCKQSQLLVENSILTKMWSDEEKRYISLFRNREGYEESSESETIQSLFPLLLDTIPKERRDSIVQSQLLNAEKFWTAFPIPSVACDNPSFEPVFKNDRNLMWRGPSWGMTNWLVNQGLEKHQYNAESDLLLQKWKAAVSQSGIYEMWNPRTGEAYGVEGLGMSTLIVDVMKSKSSVSNKKANTNVEGEVLTEDRL